MVSNHCVTVWDKAWDIFSFYSDPHIWVMFLNSTKYMYFVLLFTVEFICMYLFDKNIFDVYAYLHFRFESFPLFSLAESETCQQSATVLHATSCGWRLPCQEAQIRQCESCVNSLHPAVCLPTALVITEKHTHTHLSPSPPLLVSYGNL